VVKADGLAAGKGVVVAPSRTDAQKAVAELTNGALVAVDAAKQVVIEEALSGREVSVLLFADGRNYALMPPARDHKRIGENDAGPNTGGMGAITDASVVDSETLKLITREIIEPTLAGALHDGFPFRGVLFIGLMLTADGPRVLEYNVRFGDPEAQAILVRLKSDLFQIFKSMNEGELQNVSVDWSDDSSACVVLASAGYPGAYETGAAIRGLDRALEVGVEVFHAGTGKVGDGFATAGGRVLDITAAAPTLRGALGSCYRAIEKIGWEGMQYRRDIGQFHEKGKAAISEPNQ
jgi:phosphoribosylamine--glycine ligase